MAWRKLLIKHLYYPLMERVKGNRIRHYLQQLQQSQWWSPEELEAYRTKQLAALLSHALRTVPAYGEYDHLLKEVEHDPAAVLRQLPVLTKQQFNEQSEQYISTVAQQDQLIPNRTGGSTGRPVSFYMDRYTVEHYEAARWRGLSWHDIDIGDPSVMIWGSPIELSQRGQWKADLKERLLKNRFIISAFELNRASVHDYVQQLTKFKPAYLYGYASALYMFAKLLAEEGIPFEHQLRGVVSTAEMLTEEYRAVIEDALGCPVINEYGARDGGMIAYECQAGQMHIQAENLWLEVVDIVTKQPVARGQHGLLVMTDLNNRVMPRLRYEIGDYGALAIDDTPCACGINLPLLHSIEGRAEEFFVTSSGKLVHGSVFRIIIRSLNLIAHYQAIQHSTEQMTVRLVLKPGDTTQIEQEKAKLVRQISEQMEGININLEVVDEIPHSPSGKVRLSIREFDL